MFKIEEITGLRAFLITLCGRKNKLATKVWYLDVSLS